MPSPTDITAGQWRSYQEDGLVRLPGAISADTAGEMTDRLWAFLASKHDFHRDRPETWTTASPYQFQALTKSGAFAAMAVPLVHQAIDRLLGVGKWLEPDHWGQPLVSAPRPLQGGWQVPHQTWHLDHAPGLPGYARLFVILDDLRPQGGGTACVRGSHRLVGALAEDGVLALKSAEVKARLNAHPWFAALWAKTPTEARAQLINQGAVINGVPVAAAEMTGGPGDVILMHPYMLHAKAANVLDRPRLMLTQWVYAAA